MMTVDMDEILTYSKCPMMYKLKYKNAESNMRYINIVEKYENDLKKSIYLYFSKIQNNEEATIITLKKVWGRLWIKEKKVSDIIYSDSSSWRDSINERRKKGINSIIGFYNNYKDAGYPIVINQKYKIQIGKSLYLTGTFEVVREINNKIELINFKTEDKNSNEICINKNLELTGMSLAFRTLFNEKEDNLIYYGLNKNKIHYTNRNEKDYDILKNTVNCVAKAIYNELFYVYPDTKCFTCAYKKICLNEMR